MVWRIPQEEIDHVKRSVSVAELVGVAGVELRGSGENLIGRCKHHDDSTASLVVTPAKNLWHCMGACQTGGDAYAWVMKDRKLTFPQAHEALKALAPPLPAPASPITPAMSDDELMRAIVDYYVERGKQRSDFQAYLKKRGIDSPEMIEHFRIGYAPANPSLNLPALTHREEVRLRDRLQRLGIFRSPRAIEHLAGSLVVPVFDAEGRVVGMYGRKIRDDLRVGTVYHLYLPGPHRGVWNLGALRESKEIILCEAAIDALTLWRWGFRNVTWSYGTQGFTADHLQAFKAYGTERVLIAYDRDEAGDAAAGKLAAKLIAEEITCYRIEFPRGMDANEYARKLAPADKSLALVIKGAALIGMARKSDAPGPIDEEPPPAIAVADPPLAAAVVEAREPVKPKASPQVELPRELQLEMKSENEAVVAFGDRSYRIRGISKNTSFESLRINVLLTRSTTGAVYLDTFDLSVARQRAMFERAAAVEIGVKEEVLHREVGQILCALERIRDEAIERAREPKQQTPQMSAEERAAALDHLMAPELAGRTVDHITRCGLVGEETNKLMTYLACTSRKLERPLAIIVQSSSAAGKTMLMDTVLGCMPPEEVVRYSAITGKALFYIAEPAALKHKILAISEEQGAEQATYALKLLQSEGKLSIASTGKDPHTGRLESQEYHVEGPIMPVMTTTAPEIDEELQNRCIVLTADEDREQTRAIHQRQRAAQTIDGLLATRQASELQRLHQNAQRLLRPVLVANPYAEQLTFLDGKTRARRDHMKYLTLIRTIALLHQYQRPRKTRVLPSGEQIEYIDVEPADIALANELAHEVLGRSLDDVAPQPRKLLAFLVEMVAASCERLKLTQSEHFFTNREVREFTGWSDFQVRMHLRKLVDLEYVLVHRGGRGQTFVYELLYRGEGASGGAFVMGLLDAAQLRNNYEGSLSNNEHREVKNEPPTGPHRGSNEHGSSARKTARNVRADAPSSPSRRETAEKTLLGTESGDDTLAFPKPEKKPRVYALRRLAGDNGRDVLVRRVLYRRWNRKRAE